MIKASFGIKHEPFHRLEPTLLAQQKDIVDILHVQAQHGGFAVIIAAPGLGKTILREHLENTAERGSERGKTIVASFSRTLHTYQQLINQLAASLKIDLSNAPKHALETELIKTAFTIAREGKTLYILIDEAHLIDITSLRKLRLLFERFPKRHLLVLLGQPELMLSLSLLPNLDIKQRITYSAALLPLIDDHLKQWIDSELNAAGLGANTFDPAAIELILRNASGNLRLTKNLSHGSLIQACLNHERHVTTTHVNNVLIQPHWRTHDQLIKGQSK
jgi:MSHA biogenesis protein MshM